MPLYIAEITTQVVFVADDDADANIQAEDYAREEIDMNGCRTFVSRATRRNVPREWLTSLPWGDETEQTVETHLRAMETAAPTPGELEAAGQQRLVG